MTTFADRINGVEAALAIKAPVRVAATSNISLSGLQEIDGVAVATGDRVLVAGQSDASQNGIWVAQVGAWFRATDFNGARDIAQGTQIYVAQGDTQAGLTYAVETESPAVGSSLSIGANASGGLLALGLTATAAELNVLDGVTVTTAELNALDGVTATAAELNTLDGVTAKGTELVRVADEAAGRTALGLGTASTATTGTATGNVPVLVDVGGSPGLPAVDGSNLTGLGNRDIAAAKVSAASGTPSLLASYGIASVSSPSAGIYTYTFSTPRATADSYIVIPNIDNTASGSDTRGPIETFGANTTTGFTIRIRNVNNGAVDRDHSFIVKDLT